MFLHSRAIKWPLIAIVLLVAIAVYYALDPAGYDFFPKCPFYWLTGYKCPGCGSQRAIHHLLHLDVKGAFKENALLVTAIPYILGGFLFDYTNLGQKYPRVKETLYGLKAIIIVVIIMILFWVLRNL